MKNLLHMIKIANCGGNVPPILIKNTPCDPIETLLPGENRRGFNYGEDEHDRMKNIFMQNGSPGFATLLIMML